MKKTKNSEFVLFTIKSLQLYISSRASFWKHKNCPEKWFNICSSNKFTANIKGKNSLKNNHQKRINFKYYKNYL